MLRLMGVKKIPPGGSGLGAVLPLVVFVGLDEDSALPLVLVGLGRGEGKGDPSVQRCHGQRGHRPHSAVALLDADEEIHVGCVLERGEGVIAGIGPVGHDEGLFLEVVPCEEVGQSAYFVLLRLGLYHTVQIGLAEHVIKGVDVYLTVALGRSGVEHKAVR